MEPSYHFTIDVPVRSVWADIQRVRTSVQECLQAVFNEVEPIDALAMTTGELLENAVKYGHWTSDGARFRLCVSGTTERATVLVENPIADLEGADRVGATLAFLGQHDSAHAAYQARLVEVAARPREARGGLGLLRVAYEGGASLVHEVAGTRLRIIATLDFRKLHGATP